MLIFNTTYYVPDDMKQAFLQWLRDECFSRLERNPMVKQPRVLRMMGLNIDEQTGIAVQFGVETLADLRTWRKEQGAELSKRLAERFSGQIESFSTMMEVVEMETRR